MEEKVFRDVLKEKNVLCVVGKGLGLLSVFVRCIRVYCAKRTERENVFVLNASRICGVVENALVADGALQGSMPTVINSEIGSPERKNLYERGGCHIVTSRILVVDMLTKLLDMSTVAGFLVYNAHNVSEKSIETFCLRIFLQEGAGFVKAFSDSAESLCAGFARLPQTMSNLLVDKLQLWPRFHEAVLTSLEKNPPELIELKQPLTRSMTVIQDNIMKAMQMCLNELGRRASLNTSDIAIEDCLSRSFYKSLRRRLDAQWHTLNDSVKQLVSDISTLGALLHDLLTFDAVRFYQRLDSIRRTATRYSGAPKSMWMLTDEGIKIFEATKDRVYKVKKMRSSDDEENLCWVYGGLDGRKRFKFKETLELPPKLSLLSQILEEIDHELSRMRKGKSKKRHDSDTEFLEFGAEIVIFCRDEATCDEVRTYLRNPDSLREKRFDRFLAKSFQRHQNTMLYALTKLSSDSQSSESSRNSDMDDILEKAARLQRREQMLRAKRERHANLARIDLVEASGANLFTESGTDLDTPENFAKLKDQLQNNGQHVSSLTTEQKLVLLAFIRRNTETRNEDLQKEPEISKAETVQVVRRAKLILHPKDQDDEQLSILEEARPRFAVMFDPCVETLRRIEVFKANHPRHPLRVYFLIYKNSAEERKYFNDLKREKESFKHLIEEKRDLVPTHRTASSKPDPPTSPSSKTNIVGYNLSTGQPLLGPMPGASEPRTVVVDMREFRSYLPSVLHQQGFRVFPVTLEIGDYVLSPEIVVERKSISDLFSSFNSGRLYKQAEAMCRYYKRPALLIEFDEDRPFSLQSASSALTEISPESIISKLVILSLHFPRLSYLWSPSPRCTVQLFSLLTVNHRDPDPAYAAKLGIPQIEDGEQRTIVDQAHKISPAAELLSRLPGVNPHNSPIIMGKVKSLRDLCNQSLQDLTTMMGKTNAAKLYCFLHRQQDDSTQMKNSGAPNEMRAKRSRNEKPTNGKRRKKRGK